MMSSLADLVRAQDRDRYLAAILADQPAREHLLALYAFDLEVASIPHRISEPLIGEMRLQWWRDALAALAHGGSSGNPLADALQPAIDAGRLPQTAFEQMIDAHRLDVYGEMLRGEDELIAYCGAVFGIPVQLACLILSGGRDMASGTAAGHAGVVAGLLWVLENIGAHAARGRIYLPGDLLARHGVEPQTLLGGEAGLGLAASVAELSTQLADRLGDLNIALADLDAGLRPAFAHLATARLRIRAMQTRRNPLQTARGPLPLRRQWAIWRFMRSARV